MERRGSNRNPKRGEMNLKDALFNVGGSLGEGASTGGRFIAPGLENESAPAVIESLVAIGRRVNAGGSPAGIASSPAQRCHRRPDVVLGTEARRHPEWSAGPHAVTVPQSAQPLPLICTFTNKHQLTMLHHPNTIRNKLMLTNAHTHVYITNLIGFDWI